MRANVHSGSNSSDGEESDGEHDIPKDGVVLDTPPKELLRRQQIFVRVECRVEDDEGGDEDESTDFDVEGDVEVTATNLSAANNSCARRTTGTYTARQQNITFF